DQRSVSSWVESLSAWLNSLLPESGVTTPEDVEPIKTLTLPLNVDWSGQSERALNDDEIFIVETTFSLVRKDAHVTGALRASGIARADTKLAPYTGALSKVEGATAQARRFRQIAGVAEDATLRDLAPFAAAFTAAFSKLAGRRLEIAIGTDRERFQAGGRTTL